MKTCGCISLIIVLLLNILDWVSDWLFFGDVESAEKGLVYGPPNADTKWALLAFSIIGTFTFIAEIINLYREVRHNQPWIDSDYLGGIVTWIEDIPQVIISITIAVCREEPISIFQLTKAGVVIFATFVRFIIVVVKWCKDEKKKYRWLLGIGMFIELAGAVAIFVLTQTENTETGVSFKVPNEIIEEQFYNDQKYFANVGVFLHHTELFDSGKLDPNKNDYEANWLQVATINEIRERSGKRMDYALDYEYVQGQSNISKLSIWERLGSDEAWNLTKCYEIDRSTAGIVEKIQSTCLAQRPTTVTLSLSYEEESRWIFKKKILGDILISMKIKTPDGKCSDYGPFEENIKNSLDKKRPFTIRYYRINPNLPYQGNNHLLHTDNLTPRFFRNNGKDLQDIENVWKTGYSKCDCTGLVAPTYSRTLNKRCGRD